jgi:hypothetical protein
MAVSKELSFAELDDLSLDPRNPRLGRHNAGPRVTQGRVLELMADWKLDELAVSFLESGGFWTQEALIVTREDLYGKPHLVVIEGNRRLAALINLSEAVQGKNPDRKWQEIVKDATVPKHLFDRIPYYLADSREDIESFLGFRHVTGIEEWRPAEKAEFISKLIDKGLDYREVKRKIGSNTQTVRQNYISYRLLLQVEQTADVPKEYFEERFSVMYLSLRTEGVRQYLQIDIQADPETVRRAIPKIHKKALTNFALWLFGNEQKPPLFTDSRLVDRFGQILASEDARQYLERSEDPNFEVAYKTAGGDEPEIIKLLQKAADNVELALTRAHHYRKSNKLETAAERLAEDTRRLLELFPDIRDRICKDKR